MEGERGGAVRIYVQQPHVGGPGRDEVDPIVAQIAVYLRPRTRHPAPVRGRVSFWLFVEWKK